MKFSLEGVGGIGHGYWELRCLYSASRKMLGFPYLHYPNNRFENISVVYVLLFNSVAYKLLLGIEISSMSVMRICRSVKKLLSVLSIFIDHISQRNSIEQLKNFVIFFFRFG